MVRRCCCQKGVKRYWQGKGGSETARQLSAGRAAAIAHVKNGRINVKEFVGADPGITESCLVGFVDSGLSQPQMIVEQSHSPLWSPPFTKGGPAQLMKCISVSGDVSKILS